MRVAQESRGGGLPFCNELALLLRTGRTRRGHQCVGLLARACKHAGARALYFGEIALCILGIAHALSLAEHFVGEEKMVVVLGDNIVQEDITPHVRRFAEQPEGARLLLKKVPDPERFGVAVFKHGKITGIIEKPKDPKSPYAVIGVYMYDATVFSFIKTLKPSRRGELEITDVNNWYLKRGLLEYDLLKGFWTDAGQFESLHRANMLVARQEGYQAS